MSMTCSFRQLAILVLVPAGLALTPADAAARKCQDNGNAAVYLQQPVEHITPAGLADEFIAEVALPDMSGEVREFWEEFGTREESIDSLIAGWDEGEAAKQALTKDKALVELLQQLRRTIMAFEAARPAPEEAAELLAGEWNDWRSSHMSREQFRELFLAEIAARQDIPVYGAVLQAAQATRNRLDDLHGAAGGRDAPDDPYQMWLWDSYIRGKAASPALDKLHSMQYGEGYWTDYLLARRSVIICVAAEQG